MTFWNYSVRVNAIASIAGTAFMGGNLFIGLSMGTYWLSLEPLDFVAQFAPHFTAFLYTIMPLFLLTLLGLIMSARLDWHSSELKRIWVYAIGFYAGVSLITMAVHVPENLRLLDNAYTSAEADSARTYWLLWHVPRVLLAIAMSVAILMAVIRSQMSRRGISLE